MPSLPRSHGCTWGRVDAAAVELAARVGLRAGRVRLAGFQTVLSTLVPKAAAELSRSHPGIELNLIDAHPVEGLKLLRSGHVDIALIFRHADTPLEEEGVRLTHLLDDPLYLVSDQPHQRLEDHRDSAWVGGCERCRAATITACERAGFSPRIAYSCDDTVVAQSLVAAGMGVAIVNGLALHAHRAPAPRPGGRACVLCRRTRCRSPPSRPVRVGARAALAVRYAATIHTAVIDHWLRRLT